MYKIILRDYISSLKWSMIKRRIFDISIAIICILILAIQIQPLILALILFILPYITILVITTWVHLLLKDMSRKVIPRGLYLCPIDFNVKKKYFKKNFILKIIILAITFLLVGLLFITKHIISLKVYLLSFINFLLILCIDNIDIKKLYKFLNENQNKYIDEFKSYEGKLSYKKIILMSIIISFLAFISNLIQVFIKPLIYEGIIEMAQLITPFFIIVQIINIILLLAQFIITMRGFKYWDIIVYINTDYEEIYLK